MSRKVEVIIDPKTGTVQYEISGVVGTACEELTEALQRDNEVMEMQYTEEYETPEELPDYISTPEVEE